MLSVKSLEAGYGSIRVLEDLDLEVGTGEVVALLGGNGAGKTTTMSAISGLLPPCGGEVFLEGEPVHRLPGHKIFSRGLALVPQGRELFPEMTVTENLELGVLMTRHRSEMSTLLDRVFDFFPRLEERREQRAASLSGGEQQMLAMGRALMSRPKVVLLDEPTTGLAPIIVKELQNIIRTLNADGLTVLLVEQNTRMALNLAHRVYVINKGAIVLDKPRSAIVDDSEIFDFYMH